MNNPDLKKDRVGLNESELEIVAKLERREPRLRIYYFLSAVYFLIALVLIGAGLMLHSEALFLGGICVALATGSLFGMVWNDSKYLRLIRKLLSQG
jgi:hypothetical protein